ncbi:MAG: DNA-deoxyinosine glycosylase [Lentisphaeria bacterium]|nr:DNA-deoxyinosine glycosylase [Lentisphaeria bacterium]
MTSRCQSFPPSETPEARVLILGSMPGGESLRQHQYYAFRHNAFWRIAGTLFSFSPELPYEQRLARLRACGVALWDVLAECEREGSLDTAIRSPDPNDIPGLLARCPRIELVCCNGSAAFNCLRKFFPKLPVPAVRMISTSPAAARYTYEQKLAAWRDVLEPFLPKK